jgi:dynein heavy chain
LEYDFKKLTKFQKLILIKLLRKDALIEAVQSFIKTTLGKNFLTPSVPTLRDLYNQSVPQSPIVFILSPGN